MARISFREADTDERLKRALNSRINVNNHEFYEIGDIVSFKEEGKTKWSGPAKVIGVDGKTIHVKYGNNVLCLSFSFNLHNQLWLVAGRVLLQNCESADAVSGLRQDGCNYS